MRSVKTLTEPLRFEAISSSDVVEAYKTLSFLESYYPDFEHWYWTKVVPGLLDKTRLLHLEKQDDRIVGIMIAKNEEDEKKLCTLWVDHHFKKSGIGSKLVGISKKWLKSDKPFATVPEEKMAEFAGLLASNGFQTTEQVESLYRSGKRDFVFNGDL